MSHAPHQKRFTQLAPRLRKVTCATLAACTLLTTSVHANIDNHVDPAF
ncbi:MAG: hypothetical protein HC858_13100 [Brachymonas sp.]|nr:hypothetical protein [Brachymonas sp.]